MQKLVNLATRATLTALLLVACGMAALSLWVRMADSALLAAPGVVASTAPGAASVTTAKAADDELLSAERLSRAYRTAARRILPTAVVIKAEDEGQANACPRRGGCPTHAPRPNRTAQKPAAAPPAELSIIGSGFVVDPSGVILTNHHVIEGARGLVVKLADGRQVPVVAVESDKNLDLAALRVKTDKPLPAAVAGDPDTLEVGDMVLTVGAPLEMEQTVSAGILSAKGRTFCPDHDAKLLQTDAAIGPGSSGGPMVNLRGEVVGVATAMLSETDSFSGIGFAVPIGCAKEILDRLAKKTNP